MLSTSLLSVDTSEGVGGSGTGIYSDGVQDVELGLVDGSTADVLDKLTEQARFALELYGADDARYIEIRRRLAQAGTCRTQGLDPAVALIGRVPPVADASGEGPLGLPRPVLLSMGVVAEQGGAFTGSHLATSAQHPAAHDVFTASHLAASTQPASTQPAVTNGVLAGSHLAASTQPSVTNDVLAGSHLAASTQPASTQPAVTNDVLAGSHLAASTQPSVTNDVLAGSHLAASIQPASTQPSVTNDVLAGSHLAASTQLGAANDTTSHLIASTQPVVANEVFSGEHEVPAQVTLVDGGVRGVFLRCHIDGQCDFELPLAFASIDHEDSMIAVTVRKLVHPDCEFGGKAIRLALENARSWKEEIQEAIEEANNKHWGISESFIREEQGRWKEERCYSSSTFYCTRADNAGVVHEHLTAP
jgi:hypothetical protein